MIPGVAFKFGSRVETKFSPREQIPGRAQTIPQRPVARLPLARHPVQHGFQLINNVIEAEAVASAVASHARKTPELTLGVVTFSTVQRDAVTDILEVKRRSDPVLDGFLHEGGVEDVFVKNIENVQGDERDVILISVGYGPRTAGGKLESISFGPVSSEGGERRLNVLFTRARTRCEIFVSFASGDIVTERTKGEGPRVLKRFLQFAETGVLEEHRSVGEDFD